MLAEQCLFLLTGQRRGQSVTPADVGHRPLRTENRQRWCDRPPLPNSICSSFFPCSSPLLSVFPVQRRAPAAEPGRSPKPRRKCQHSLNRPFISTVAKDGSLRRQAEHHLPSARRIRKNRAQRRILQPEQPVSARLRDDDHRPVRGGSSRRQLPLSTTAENRAVRFLYVMRTRTV